MSSMLPQESYDIEKRLELLSDRYDFKNPSLDLWNADKCPKDLLIYLAWALSVDLWDESWAEDVKRSVCRESLDIHRLKGTTYALQKSVDNLGYSARLIYWHQNKEIDKGRFRVVVSDENEIPSEKIRQINEVIEKNKRGTLHLDRFTISGKTKSSVKSANFLKCGETVKIMPLSVETYITESLISSAAMVRVIDRVKVLPIGKESILLINNAKLNKLNNQYQIEVNGIFK